MNSTRHLLVLLVVVMLTGFAAAEAPALGWQQSFGGSGYDVAQSIIGTSDWGYAIAGFSDTPNDGDVTGNHGGNDFWVAKLDSSGTLDWQKSLGGSGGDLAFDINQTRDGGYIVAGYSNSADGDVSENKGMDDFWVVKLDSSGGIEWQKSLGGSGEDTAKSVVQTPDGGYIVTGQSWSIDGDVTGNHGGYDYWVVKLDSSGGIEWQNSYGGSSEDYPNHIALTSDGGYIIAGYSSSGDGDVTGNHGADDYWIVKLDSSGGIEWEKSLGGSLEDAAFDISQTRDGGYITTGTTNSVDGDVTGFHGGNEDYWVVKLDSSGGIEWQKALGGSGNELPPGIVQTQDSGYIVAGQSGSTDGDVTGNHGFDDYWVVKLDSSGTLDWQKSLGGSWQDWGKKIVLSPDGGYIVGGSSGSADGDVSVNRGGQDYWVVKLGGGSSAPVADFSGTPTTGKAPLTVQFTDLSTGEPTGWAWYFGDEDYSGGWTQVSGGPVWLDRSGQSSVAMPDGSIVATGGYGGGYAKNDTWRSTDHGATWTQINANSGWPVRYGHTSVVMPDGSIVLLGGSDGGNFLNDVWRSADKGVTWTEMTANAPWSARYRHTSVAMPDGSIVLMGSEYTNDVWRSTDNGATWTEMTAHAGWSARYTHSCVAMPDGSIVLTGGEDFSGVKNDTWRSTDNGATWTQMNANSGWPARFYHESVVMPDGSILLMGGLTQFGSTFNDVWRSMDSGSTWTQVNADSGWGPGDTRQNLVSMPDGSIVLIDSANVVWRFMPAGSSEKSPSHTYTKPGSYDVSLQVINDGGSNNARKAGYITVGGLSAVADFTADITFGTAPLTVAFTDLSTNTPTRWNWSFGDGELSDEQNPVHSYASIGTYTISLNAINTTGSDTITRTNYIVVTGPKPVTDFSANVTSGAAPLPIQFSDLSLNNPTGWAWFFGDEDYSESWMQVNASAGWSTRSGHSSLVLPDGHIVLMGGVDNIVGWKNDVWLSMDNGTTWKQVNMNAGWSPRYGHTSVAMPDGSIVLMGGSDGTNGFKNDVWRSTDEGITWTQMNSGAEWSRRYAHCSLVMPDGSIVLMGGEDYSGYKNDVWRSSDNGATWTQIISDAGWSARNRLTCVVMSDGSIILMGGADNVIGLMNDVWRSTDNGATWTEINASAGWSAKVGHTSVAISDDSILLMGGETNDVWRSTDNGATWNEVRTGAEWTPRRHHSSVVLPDGSIVLIGGQESIGSYGLKNDVWRLPSAGSLEQTPSHTYSRPGTYTVTLQTYNAGGSNSARKTGYIAVGGSSGPVHNLNSGLDYAMIQAAVNAASAGDTLVADSGTYPEHVTVDRTLTIRGNDTGSGLPVVDGGGIGDVITINAGEVTLDGLVAIHSGSDEGHGFLIKAENGTFLNLTASGNFVGIGVNSNNSTVSRGNFSGNSQDGMQVVWSNDNHVFSNNASSNGASGIYVAYGASDNTINSNIFTGNTWGIYFGDADTHNTVYNNYFSNSANTAGAVGQIWNITRTAGTNIIGGPYLGGNFWSDYPGTDADGDGFGDTPYTNNIPSSADYLPLVKNSGLPGPASFIAIDPIDDKHVGDKFTITAMTNLSAGTPVSVDVINMDMVPEQSVVSGTVTVQSGTGFLNQTQFDVDSSTFKPALYKVNETSAEYGVTNITFFAVLGGGVVLPVADFTATPTYGAAPLSVQFNDMSDAAGALMWNWSFGDGSGSWFNTTDSEERNASFVYTSAGTYDVSLTVTNASGSNTASKSNYIQVWIPDAPIADFSGSPTSGSTPLTVQFNDTSNVVSPQMWNWSFGDSPTSWFNTTDIAARNASYVYPNLGTYDVSLTVSNLGGSNTKTRTNFITVRAPAVPVSGFSGEPKRGIVPLEVHFMDSSDMVDGISWNWSFGDTTWTNATFSSGPIHTYLTEGTYDVSLIVTNSSGSDIMTRTSYITVNEPAPASAFSGTPTNGPAPLSVTFTDVSTGDPAGWAWFFGDEDYTEPWTQMSASAGWLGVTGQGSVVMPDGSIVLMSGSKTWRSTDSGTTWTLINASSGWSASGPSCVALPDGSIVLTGGGFKGNDTWRSMDSGTTWILMNASSGWTGRTQHRSVVLPDGSIVLMGGSEDGGYINDNDVWQSTDKGATWTQMTAHAGWTPRFGHSSVVLHDGSIVVIFGLSQPYGPGGEWIYNADVWLSTDKGATWTQITEFAEGGRYGHSSVVMPDGSIVLMGGHRQWMSLADVYRSTDNGVTWTHVNESIPTAGESHASVVMPDGSIVVMGSNFMNDAKSETWRFQPAGSSEKSPSHTYSTSGTYPVSLQVYNTGGYNNTRKTGYITVGGSAPVAGFTGTPTSGPAPLAVQFNDTSDAAGALMWNWSFGDGSGSWFNSTDSEARNASFVYSSAGTYDVSLTVTNASGGNTSTRAGYITVTAPAAPPVADFSGTPTTGSVPLEVTFTDSSDVVAGTMWNWSFGDTIWTNTTIKTSPVHTFLTAGTYDVSLTVTNASGSDIKTKTNYITVREPAPSAAFSGIPTTGTVPLTVTFTDESTGAPTGWAWYFGDESYTEPWTQQTASAGWSEREYYTSVELPDGSIVLTGGNTITGLKNDTWLSMDYGKTWSKMAEKAGWTARQGHTSVAMPDGSIVLMGGEDITGLKNDVWRSTDKGVTWTEMTENAGWIARKNHNSIAMPDGSIVLLGGGDSSFGTMGDVWRSTDNGATWTLMTDHSGIGGTMASCVAIPDSSLVYINGGAAVFRSTDYGVTWIRMTENAGWPVRAGPISVAMPDGSIVVMGGHTITSDTNDVWRSTDNGATWNQVTPNAGWSPRVGSTTVAMPDGSIVLVGGDGKTDVWRLMPAGSLATYPTHTYTSQGTYSVTLQVFNDAGFNSTRKTGYIVVKGLPGPDASFSGTPTSGSAPLPVQFNDTSDVVSPQSWNWSFGDSLTSWFNTTDSAARNASHVYSSAGTYTVSLTVTNASGSDTKTLANYITVMTSPKPVVSFTGKPVRGQAPLPVQFNDTSDVVSPQSWNWSFGDGTTSWFNTTDGAYRNASHLYSSPGSYDVSLIVTNASGSSILTEINYINIESTNPVPAPSAAFIGTPTTGQVPLTVTFTDESTGNPTGRAWYFGDESYAEPWTQVTNSAEWSERAYYPSVMLPDGSIVLMGGNNGSYLNDTWRSMDKGAIWSKMTENAGWTARQGHSSVAMPDGSIVLMGGEDLTGLKNDVWRSMDKGATWTEMTENAGWIARKNHNSVAMPDGSIVLMGGGDSGFGLMGDVWRSTDNGATWTLMTEHSGIGGTMASCVAMPDRSIVYLNGGATVFRSTDYGVTWTHMTENAGWPERAGPITVVMSDGSIVVVGGITNTGSKNDVWRSTDTGATWNQVTPNAEWSARVGSTGFAMPDGSIVLVGGDGKTDVWQLMPAGSLATYPTHTYASPGTYSVTLQVFNDAGFNSTRKSGYIKVKGSPTPIADFTGNPTSGAVPLTVQFNDTSDALSPQMWNWSFGDGTSSWFNTTDSETRNASFVYTSAGTYDVSLTVTNASGSNTATRTGYITVTAPVAPPVASFSGTPTTGTAPLDVTFTDSSDVVDGTMWNWSFGDTTWTNTTIKTNPVHTYLTAGTYDVSLTVTNATGSNTVTKTGYIIANPSGSGIPKAKFSGTPTNGDAPLIVTFTDSSDVKAGTMWNWSFGDATWTNTTTKTNPVHTYLTPGTYDVSLMVTNASGSNAMTKTWYVLVMGEPTLTNGKWHSETADSSAMAGFYSSLALDANSDPYIGFSWGDNSRDLRYTSKNTSGWHVDLVGHQFDDIGQYLSLTLDTSDNPHISSYSQLDNDLIHSWKDATGWHTEIADSTGNNGEWSSLALDSSSNPHISYQGATNLRYAVKDATGWHTEVADSDGPGSFTSLALDGSGNPHISYHHTNATSRNLKYAWKDSNGWHSETVDNNGDVGWWVGMYSSLALDESGNPHISYYDGSGSSGNQDLKYAWKDVNGWHTITLDSGGDVGQYTSLKLDKNGYPHISYVDNTHHSLKYAWKDAAGWHKTTLKSGSVYYATSLALDGSGNPHISYYYDGYGVNYIWWTPDALPLPVVSANTTTGTAPLTVQFSSSGSDVVFPTGYFWTFGDGFTSYNSNPMHSYTGTDIYDVSLKINNATGSNTTTILGYITVTGTAARPVASFAGTPVSGAAPLTVQFNDTSDAVSPQMWNWSFGDGAGSWFNTTDNEARNASFIYASAGTYDVSLMVTNVSGSNTAIKNNFITVNSGGFGLPVAIFSGTPTNGNAPLIVTFTDSSDIESGISWNWSFGDRTWTNTTSRSDPVHTYLMVGTYEVSLTITNATGSNTVTQNGYITVNPGGSGIPAAGFSGSPLSGTVPLEVTFTDSSDMVEGTMWNWSFGDTTWTNTTTPSNPVHTYLTSGTYDVSLTVTNVSSSSTVTKTGYINVYTPESGTYVLAGQWRIANGLLETKDVTGLAIDPSDNVYLSDPLQPNPPFRLRKFSASGVIYPKSWDEVFDSPVGIDVSNGGVLYVADKTVSKVWHIIPGNDFSYNDVASPTGVAVDPSGNVYITTTAGNLINKISAGTTWGTAGSGDGQFSSPVGIASDSASNVYIADSGNCRIQKFDSEGTYLSQWGTCGTGNGQFQNPTWIAVDSSNVVYVSDTGNYRVQKFSPDGTYLTQWGTYGSGAGQFLSPRGIAVNSTGYVYVVDALNDRVEIFSPGTPHVPVTDFIVGSSVGTLPMTVQFYDESTYSPTSWAWDFGDGGTSTDRDPVHEYAAAGIYTVTLTASNTEGSDTKTKVGYITVASLVAPVSEFTSNVTSGSAPLAVQFTDLSENYPTSWAWDFGDGITSDKKDPVHKYRTAGTHNVTLTVTNLGGSDTKTKTEYITVYAVTPIAAFSATPTTGNAPQMVQFTDESVNYPTSWAWDFGDGSTSTEKNPNHEYTADGIYTVNLTVTNSAGSDDENKVGYILMNAVAPVAAFSATPLTGTAPLTVQFTDESANNPTSWEWDFGDGSMSYMDDPVHEYIGAGTYTVTLAVTNSAGSDTEIKGGYITVSSGGSGIPTAGFSGAPTSGTVPLDVTFTDSSDVVAGTLWNWSFGDDSWTNTTISSSPVHTYMTSGTYDVSLTVTNASGSNTMTRAGYIKVKEPAAPPIVSFSGTPTSGTVPLEVTFTDGSDMVDGTMWNWSFGDTMWTNTTTNTNPVHTYLTDGIYDVSLTVTNASGSNTATKTHYINVYGTSESETYVLASQWRIANGYWQTNDVTGIALDSRDDVYLTDPLASTFQFRVLKFNSSGVKYSTYWDQDFAYPKGIAVQTGTNGPVYIAEEGGALKQLYDPGWEVDTSPRGVAVDPSGNVYVTTIGGEIRKIIGETIVRTWGTAGSGDGQFNFPVGIAADSASNVYIADSGNCRVQKFDSEGTYLDQWGTCGTGEGQFQNPTWIAVDSSNAVYVSDTGNYRVQKFSPEGNYLTQWGTFGSGAGQFLSPRGIAVNSSGFVFVVDAGNDRVEIFSPGTPNAPVTDFVGAPLHGIPPLTVQFNDTSDAVSPQSWNWSFGESPSSWFNTTDSAARNASYVYTSAGTYSVSLTVTNASGSHTVTMAGYITVNSAGSRIPVAKFSGTPTNGDAPLIVTFTDSSDVVDGTMWNWSFGDSTWTNMTSSSNLVHTYLTPGIYDLALTVTNASGSNTKTEAGYITVTAPAAPPVADFSGDPVSGIAPLAVTFTDSSDVVAGTMWNWSFGDSTWTNTTSSSNLVHTYLTDGIYDISLTVTNESGSNTATKTHYINVYGTSERETYVLASQWRIANGYWQTNDVMGIALDSRDDVYLTDPLASTFQFRVLKFNSSGVKYSTYWDQDFAYPKGIAVQTGTNGPVYIAEEGGALKQLYDPGWEVDTSPRGVAVDPSGNVYVTTIGGEIRKIIGETIVRTWGTAGSGDGQFSSPMGIAADSAGNVYIADSGNCRIQKFDSEGTYIGHWGTCGTGNGQFQNPTWIAVDSSNAVYVSDTGNYRVQKFSPEGNYLTQWGTFGSGAGQFLSPRGIAVNSSGFVYVVDAGNDRVEIFSPGTPNAPVTDFVGAPLHGIPPLTVQFNDTSEAVSPQSWNWSFGESPSSWFNTTDSAARNASYVYTSAGTYSVSLTVTNASGSDTKIQMGYITIMAPPAPPVAAFGGEPVSGIAPLAVTFTDSSDVVAGTLWNWSFGDETWSNTTTKTNPVHTYQTAGTYDISLTVTNATGSNSITKTGYITVSGTPTPVNASKIDVVFIMDVTGSMNPQLTMMRTSVTSTIIPGVIGTGNHPDARFGVGSFADYPHTYNSFGYNAVYGNAGSDYAYQQRQDLISNPALIQTAVNNLHITAGADTAEATARALYESQFFSWRSDARKVVVLITDAPPHAAPNGYSLMFKDGVTPVFGPDGGTTGPYGGDPGRDEVMGTLDDLEFGHVVQSLADNGIIVVAVGPSAGGYSNAYNSSRYIAEKTNGKYLNYTLSAGKIVDAINEVAPGPAVMAPPVAGFSGNPTSGTVPLEVIFTDSSDVVAGTMWNWSFGDTIWSNTTTRSNPVHTYMTPGTYDVSLTVANASGSNTAIKNHYVVVNPGGSAIPAAGFSGAPTSGPAPLQVTFTDSSDVVSGTMWNWSFGDNVWTNTTTKSNPAHTYLVAGTYDVSLTVTNASGSDTKIQMGYITIMAPPALPVAEFGGDPVSGIAPLEVTFSDRSDVVAGTMWNWSFGDTTWSNTTSKSNPVHTYLTEGTYDVSLTVTNASGSNAVTKSSYITVIDVVVAPVAGFTAGDTSGTAPLTVIFTDTSLNTPTSWHWDFGDGNLTNATDQSPVHTYLNPGTFTVSLTATNAGGDNTRTRTGYIKVKAIPAPAANFNATDRSGNAPFTVSFLDSSSRSPTSWQWAFGDGSTSIEQNPVHIYLNPGKYDVSLTATNGGGSDTKIKTGYITVKAIPPPAANFNANDRSGNAPFTVSFLDSSSRSPTSWHWDFGDGNLTNATDQSPVHTYLNPGTFTVSLTATNGGGSDTKTKTGYITVKAIPPPAANFNATDRSGNAPFTVSFLDSSSRSPTSWHWDFGDGNLTNATDQSPVHTYLNPGTFTVSLTATNGGGSDTKTKTGYITVKAIPPPAANFNANNRSGYAPLAVTLNDTSSRFPTSWHWDFGDGSTSTQQNPVHLYVNPGKYDVSLIATNAGGSDTKTKTGYITVSVPRPPN